MFGDHEQAVQSVGARHHQIGDYRGWAHMNQDVGGLGCARGPHRLNTE
jgi:hypothetical protein